MEEWAGQQENQSLIAVGYPPGLRKAKHLFLYMIQATTSEFHYSALHDSVW